MRRRSSPPTKRRADSDARPHLSEFARRLFAEWRRLDLPLENQAILVAVSGGADSIALLLALEELIEAGKLSLNLSVAHLDHGLRPSSKMDSRWVSHVARQLGYRIISSRVDVAALALSTADNLEQAARRARYAFLEKTAESKRADLILVAHTMDDQAETVILRLLRGSGSEGLSGMQTVRPLREGSRTRLVRPLLAWARRHDTEHYCRRRKVEFIVDDMNHDERFARVRVRKQLLPLMQSFNNRIVETLSRTASLLGDDSAALEREAAELLLLASENGIAKIDETLGPALNVAVLSQAPVAQRRRALRQWIAAARGDLRRLERVHLLAVEGLLEGGRGGRTAELPAGVRVRRKGGWLQLYVKKG